MEPGPLHRALKRIDHLHHSESVQCKITTAGELDCERVDTPPSCLPPTGVPQPDVALISHAFYTNLRRHGTEFPHLRKALDVYAEEWWERILSWYPNLSPEHEKLLMDQEVKDFGWRNERFRCVIGQGGGVECRFRAPKSLGRSAPLYLEGGTAVMTKGFFAAVMGNEVAASGRGGAEQCIGRVSLAEKKPPTPTTAQSAAGTTVAVKFVVETKTAYVTLPAEPSRTPHIDDVVRQISSLVHDPSFAGHPIATRLLRQLERAVVPTSPPRPGNIAAAAGITGHADISTGEVLVSYLRLLSLVPLICLVIYRVVELITWTADGGESDPAEKATVQHSCASRKMQDIRVGRPACLGRCHLRRAYRGRAQSPLACMVVVQQVRSAGRAGGNSKRSDSRSSVESDISIVSFVSDEGSEAFELLDGEDLQMPRHAHGS